MKQIYLLIIAIFTISIANAQLDKSSVVDTCIMIQLDSKRGNNGFIFQIDPSTNYSGYQDFISFDWTFSGTESLGYSLIL